MKWLPTWPKKAALAAVAGGLLALAVLPGCKKAVKPPAPVAAKPAATATAASAASTNTVAGGTNLPSEYVSVFDDRPPPENKGRDPFNPDSTVRNPVAPVQTTPSAAGPVDPQFKLYSVGGSPGRYVVYINNQMLTLKDPPTAVRVAGGTVIIKVVEIGEDYADIVVEGTPGKKRLTLGQKK